MKTLIGIIAGLILGFVIGMVGSAWATPLPAQDSTEARLQALEYLFWTEEHAINHVSQRLWERYSSCNITYGDSNCYNTDLVLLAFNVPDQYGQYPDYDAIRYLAAANTHGKWYAQDNGDGDSWRVWVVISGKQYTWDVWQSNGFIRGVY
jgi:hypothetical protein